MTRSKSFKILSALTLLFALPVTTLAGTISMFDGEKNYSSIEEYQGVSKQSNVVTLSADEHDNHTDWNQLTSSTTTLTEGYWYLSEDVTTENTITIEEDADVTLCLNGHTLTVGNLNGISIENNTSESETTFTLSDCSDEQDGEICFSDDIISDSSAKYILGATNNSSNSSIEINFTGGTINAKSTSSAAYGLYTQNNGSFSNTTIDINIDGGFINATTNSGLSTAVRAYIYGNSTTYTQNSSININMISGGIYASSSSYAARSIFGNIASNTRYCSIALTISGGTIQYGEGNSNSAGLYISNNSSTTNTISTIINGGYHDYSNINIDFTVTVVVNAGYFTEGAYNALSSYVPDTSILKTFTSTDDALALDGEYDENYPNAVYVKGSEADVSAPSTVCVGTDVEQYILVNNNSSLSVNYSYTGTTSGNGLPTEIGEYEVTLTYGEHVSGNTPKEYFESGSSTISLTIANHTPSTTASYNESHHWFECTNDYCDQAYTEASGYGEHSFSNDGSSCETCDYTTSSTDPEPENPTTYTVTYESNSDYTVNGLSDSYEAGDTVTFTISITDPTSKEIDYVTWNDNTIEPDASGTYSFTMPENNVVLNIALKDVIVTYSLTYQAGSEDPSDLEINFFNTGLNEITASEAGDTVLVDVYTTSTTLEVDKIYYNNTEITETYYGQFYSFTMPSEDVVITIDWKEVVTTPTTYTVSYTESEDYTVSGLEDSYQANQIVSFTVTVTNMSKEIDHVRWNENTIEPDSSGTYSFTMPEENVVLTISLKDVESEQEPDDPDLDDDPDTSDDSDSNDNNDDDNQDTDNPDTPNTDTDASSSNGLTWLYIVIPIVAVVILAIIIIFILKSRSKKKNKSA